ADPWQTPIKARIDMLSTGTRPPVGIKIFGNYLGEISKLGGHLESVLRDVPGTRSVYAERTTGGYYLDIIPNRREIARLSPADVDGYDAYMQASESIFKDGFDFVLEEALRVAAGPRARAEIALEVAEAYAALFRWVDAVDVIERALAELGPAEAGLAARLEGELVVCGLHDARRATRGAPVLARL
ncbi:AcrB/AcrD/AcrF family protein, partial [Lacticaseibacillus rhamnosus]